RVRGRDDGGRRGEWSALPAGVGREPDRDPAPGGAADALHDRVRRDGSGELGVAPLLLGRGRRWAERPAVRRLLLRADGLGLLLARRGRPSARWPDRRLVPTDR